MFLLAPFSDVAPRLTRLGADPETVLGIGTAILMVMSFVVRPLRPVSLLALVGLGLVKILRQPASLDGIVLILFGAFLVFDSGWVVRHRPLAIVGLSVLVVAVQLASLGLSPESLLANGIHWVVVDGLVAALVVTFRRDLFGKEPDRRPVLLLSEQGLTPRELQIVHFVWGGLTPKAIADALGLTHGRVRNQLTQIYRKLGVADGKELLSLVHSHRILVDPSEESEKRNWD